MSKHIDAVIETADRLLAEEQAPVCVRLPELWRGDKRVVRQAALRFDGSLVFVSYQERSGDVSAPFIPITANVCDDVLEALAWAEGEGHCAS